MPNLIKLGQGVYDNYAAISAKDDYQVYFTTDTQQIFLGSKEYTKGTRTLGAVPTAETAGNPNTLYYVASNQSLYLCSGGTAGAYVWTRVANVNDFAGVTSVAAGEGLETDVTGGGAITETGTISHSVPVGATTVVDPTADAAPGFGSTFAIQGVSTDKFGHVTASNTRTITLPAEPVIAVGSTAAAGGEIAFGSTFAAVTDVSKGAGTHEIGETVTTFSIPAETVVSVGTTTAAPETLANGGSFTVVTSVDKGDGSHELIEESKTFTLPTSFDTTYTISSVTEGVVTLTPNSGEASTALINGWNDLAKKSDITAVFRYKGTVATVADLPAIAEVGDVYTVTTGAGTHSSTEYVCVTASETGTPAAQYEELGPVVDLSAYATTAYVQDEITAALTWKTF